LALFKIRVSPRKSAVGKFAKMIVRPTWRMREEGEMLAFVSECPDCHHPASGVVSSQLLQFPLRNLPEVFCSRCRKRFPAGMKDLVTVRVNTRRCG
jgi:hypothetical protein